QLHQTPGLRHFAGTGVLAARRSVDDEDARLLLAVIVTVLRLLDRLPRPQPIDGDIVVGVGKSRACLARDGCLATVAVGIPGRSNDRIDLLFEWLERRIDEAAAVP